MVKTTLLSNFPASILNLIFSCIPNQQPLPNDPQSYWHPKHCPSHWQLLSTNDMFRLDHLQLGQHPAAPGPTRSRSFRVPSASRVLPHCAPRVQGSCPQSALVELSPFCIHNKNSIALSRLYYNCLFSRGSSVRAGIMSVLLAQCLVPIVPNRCF